MTKQQYPYIRAWGVLMGSYEYYVKMQIEQALSDQAPQDAIYKDHDNGRWHRWSEMKKDNPNKAIVEGYAKNYGRE